MPGSCASSRDQEIARAPEPRPRVRDRRLALRDRRHARVLDERRRARRVVLDELAQVRHQRRRRDDPAQPPAGHQPRLGKAVGADDALVRRRRGRGTTARRARRRDSRGARTRRPPRARCRGGGNDRGSRCCSARVSVQPVGLFGELIMQQARVRASARRAAGRGRASTRRRQTRAARTRLRADRIFGISTRFGHSGVTTTTRSPGATSASTVSISADMPDAVTAIVVRGRRPMQAARRTPRSRRAAAECRSSACRTSRRARSTRRPRRG